MENGKGMAQSLRAKTEVEEERFELGPTRDFVPTPGVCEEGSVGAVYGSVFRPPEPV